MWMATTDDRGVVKYWQSNMNNVHTFQAHNDPIRGCRWELQETALSSVIFACDTQVKCTLLRMSECVLCCCVCLVYVLKSVCSSVSKYSFSTIRVAC